MLSTIRSAITSFIDAVRNLFRRKPKNIELRWSGLGTAPDSGTFALASGTAGKASTAWDIPTVPAPNGRPVKFAVTLSAPVEGGIDVMLYKFIGSNMIPMWVPTVSIPAGQKSGEYLFAPGELLNDTFSVIAWGARRPGLGNTKPVDIQAVLTVAP